MPKWRLFYHIVWATKARQPVIDAAVEAIVRASIRDTSRVENVIVHAVGIMPDHAHVAASIPPSLSLARYVGRSKGASTRAVNLRVKKDDGEFAWQAEYGIFSFSERNLPAVVEYVSNQRARHASRNLWTSYEDVGSNEVDVGWSSDGHG